jgi:hypothetical protein
MYRSEAAQTGIDTRRATEGPAGVLDLAIDAIREAEASIKPQPPWNRGPEKIIEVLEMKPDWTARYYSAEAKAKIEARRQTWTPALQARVEQQWMELFRDIEASLGEDPAGQKAQSLAARWRALVEGFTGGDPEISAGLKKLHKDEANWPAEAEQQMKPFMNIAVREFISKAMACKRPD